MSSFSHFQEKFLYSTRIGLLIAAIIVLIVFAHQVLFLIFAGVLLSILFHAAGRLLQKAIPIRQVWLALISGLIIVGGVSAAAWFLGSHVSDQIQQLGTLLDRALETLGAAIPALEGPLERLAGLRLEDLSSERGLAPQVTGALTTTFGVVSRSVFLVFLAFFFTAEPALYREGAMNLLPKKHFKTMSDFTSKAATILERWLAGKLLSMLIVGVLTGLGLWLLGIPLPWVLGTIAGLVSFIPNIGPLIALVPGLLVALTVSPLATLWTFLIYAAVQFIESNILTPAIQRKAVYMPPALILSSQLILGALFGLPGIALATPLLAVALVGVRHSSILEE